MARSLPAGALASCMLMAATLPLAAQGTGGAAVPCLTDWSRTALAREAPNTVPELIRAGRCADASTIRWDEIITTLDGLTRHYEALLSDATARYAATAASARADSTARETLDGMRRFIDTYRRLVDAQREALGLARAERDHLRERLARQASAPIASRTTPAAAPARSASAKAAVAPPSPEALRDAKAPWVPPSKKRLPHFGLRVGTATSDGPATMTRGGRTIRLVPGQPMDLEEGDIIDTDRGGTVSLDVSGGHLTIRGASTFQVGGECGAVGPGAAPPLRAALAEPGLLLRGVVNWVTGTPPARNCRCPVQTPVMCACVRGTDFDILHGESGGEPSSMLTVRSGTVMAIDRSGTATDVDGGASRSFRSTGAPPPDARLRAVMSDEPVRDGGTTVLPAVVATLRLDDRLWDALPGDANQPAARSFRSKDGVVTGSLIGRLWPLDRDGLRQAAIDQVRGLSSDARLVYEEWQPVGGLTVLHLEFELTKSATVHLLVGHFFTGAQGTAAATMLAPATAVRARAAEISDVLDSLAVASRFTASQQ